jgi:hypothetical protein
VNGYAVSQQIEGVNVDSATGKPAGHLNESTGVIAQAVDQSEHDTA